MRLNMHKHTFLYIMSINYIKKQILISILIFFCISLNYAQDITKIDSLNKDLKTETIDSNKVVLLTKIAVNFWFSNPDTSLTIAKKALKIAKKIDFKRGVGNCLHVIGYTYVITGNYAEALNYNLKALNIRQKINDLKGIERSYNNIGIIYLDQENYEKASFYYEKGLKVAKKINNKKDVALLSNNLGRMNYHLKRYKKAIEYCEEALKIAHLNNFKFEEMIALLNLGRIYTEMKQFDKALQYILPGLEKASRAKNREKKSMALADLAYIYYQTNRIDKSIIYSKQALKEASKINSLRYMQEAAQLLYEIYNSKQNYQLALKYYRISDQTNDSMFNEKSMRTINNLINKYELDKKQKEIQLLQKDKLIAQEREKNQKIYTWIFAIGSFLLIVLTYILFRSRQKEQKSKKLLEGKNYEIIEKNTVLNAKNEKITLQKKEIEEQHFKIQKIYKIVEEKNNNIMQSLVYASRIQSALLPSAEKLIARNFDDYFIIFKPRDYVSGDFYWAKKAQNAIYIAIADCTGHGVPGALMSMLGISLLNQIVNSTCNLSANEVLNSLRNMLIQLLRQSNTKEDPQDGMDISLSKFYPENNKLEYSGAYNSLYILRPIDKEIFKFKHIELKGNRMPIGIHPFMNKQFENKTIELKKNDLLYMFTDGYSSQFGGKNYEKYKTSRLIQKIDDIADNKMNIQKSKLEKEFINWQNNNDQIDDILIMGLKV